MQPLQSEATRTDDEARPSSGSRSTEHVGRVFGGRYRVISRVGVGGMGAVYLVEHLALGCRMALKVLNTGFLDNGAAARRFRHEACVGARLRHPNLVAVFDYEETECERYFAMEILEGRDLKRVLEEDGALSVQRAIALMLDALAGMDAAHAVGIVHRDLKPANLFVETTPAGERCRVLDFGVAKLADGDHSTLTDGGSPLGTIAYMPPEQARDARQVDARADVYSACAVLFEMIAGERLLVRERPAPDLQPLLRPSASTRRRCPALSGRVG